MLTFQRLDVYRCAMEFLALVPRYSSQAGRGHGTILDQLKRAASSIPLNIGEAAGRTGEADARRCYAIARGSAMECVAALDTLEVLGGIDRPSYEQGVSLLQRIVSMLTKLCR